MKILQICHKAPYPANDGGSIGIYHMACGFIENGVHLTLLSINTSKHYKPDHNIPLDFRTKSHYQSVFHNTDVTFAGAVANLFSNKSYFVSRFYFTAFVKEIENTLNKKWDIVHLESLFLGDYIPVIRRCSKAKIALRTHNIEHLIWERMVVNERNLLKKKYLEMQKNRLKKFEIDVLNKVDSIITISASDKKVLEGLGVKNNCFVSPTGINLQDYSIWEMEEENSVFHFGSMDWMPNEQAVIWFLENVWPKVLQKVPVAKFYIAGRGITSKLVSWNKPNVIIVGEVADSSNFYNSKSIMVVPLLAGSGIRIKILEGMAYGKAIVSTTLGAEGIPVTPGQHCILADTPDDFAQGVITLLTDNLYRRHIKSQTRKFIAENFDNKDLVGKLVRFYDRLIS